MKPSDSDYEFEVLRSVQARAIESNRSVTLLGIEMLKATLLVNGGAGIALLAFAASVWDSEQGASVLDGLSAPLLRFGLGVSITIIGLISNYMSHLVSYYKDSMTVLEIVAPDLETPDDHKFRYWYPLVLTCITAACLGIALVIFISGLYSTYEFFTNGSLPN